MALSEPSVSPLFLSSHVCFNAKWQLRTWRHGAVNREVSVFIDGNPRPAIRSVLGLSEGLSTLPATL